MEEFDLRRIESKNILKNPDWFYHGFGFEKIDKILKNGILAKKYLDYYMPNFGANGKYYISVSKDLNYFGNAFDNYRASGPLVIIDNIKAIKCDCRQIYSYFCKTILPFRYSEWGDEYLVYSKILPEKFVGIECMVYDWVKSNNLFLLKRFRDMLETMQSLDIQLPIYDFSRQENNMVHELDKESFLELSKHL